MASMLLATRTSLSMTSSSTVTSQSVPSCQVRQQLDAHHFHLGGTTGDCTNQSAGECIVSSAASKQPTTSKLEAGAVSSSS